MEKPLYVGIDLGTTNSAAAVFDGEETSIVRNAEGGSLTPSVVRIDARGRVSTGVRARRFIERDPRNTASEFKRLMGTSRAIEFPAASVSREPQELAAEILRSLRTDIEQQLGVAPESAVVSVPALFELPQSAATSAAAKLAGFAKVELLQEPIASALAAGWSAEHDAGRWLVYDLGGGTFDASLLETADGFLRVVGHDGDNFLGGRDFDWALVEWLTGEIEREHGVTLRRSDPAHAVAIAALKHAAEEAKIELSRADTALVAPPGPLVVAGAKDLEVEIEIGRTTLEGLVTPVVDRTIDVCRRLLERHGVADGQLARIVLVGGPTATPFVRDRVAARLGAPLATGLDPMTLVARGAAIYAATAGLDARPVGRLARRGRRLWLQYPPVSSDLSPHVIGRVVEGDAGARPRTIRLFREDGAWGSEEAVLDGEGAFVIGVELVPRRASVFRIEARDAAGEGVPVDPQSVTIVQGLTITDPPLSRSIGVALASDHVHVYFDKGTALPARRTFVHQTIESVAKGSGDSLVKVPIVQGEHDRAHLCRLVGTLEITGAAIAHSLPAGADVELTLEVDRGGRLSARALVPALDQVFEEVAHLLVPAADPGALSTALDDLRGRLHELRGDAFRHGEPRILAALERIDRDLAEVDRDLAAAEGGDEDAGQRARRNLLEIDAALDEAEKTRQWPELEQRAVQTMTWATSWVAHYGTEREQKLLDEIGRAVDRARADRDVRELQRQLRLADQLGETAYFRDPDTWPTLFERAASRADSARDLPKAQSLVREGRDAMSREDTQALRRVVEKLWKLLPHDPELRKLGYDSGVR